jgi:hypothetical protein
MAKRGSEFFEIISEVVFKKPFGSLPLTEGQPVPDSYLRDLLGTALYTKDNFGKLFNAV